MEMYCEERIIEFDFAQRAVLVASTAAVPMPRTASALFHVPGHMGGITSGGL